MTKTFVCVNIYIGDILKIEKIEKLKNGKYKIYFESDSIIVYDNVILKNNLLYKKDIDNDTYKRILEDNNYYEVYDSLVKYISKKRRSEKEIREYINKKYLNFNYSNDVINKLKEIGLINDLEYCKAFINDKIYLSKIGINKIKSELIDNGIPLDIINLELDRVDKTIIYDRLEKLILKKIKTNKNKSSYNLRQKILIDMINLGYEKELIEDILSKKLSSNEDDSILEKEFEKNYSKLSKKYTGFELSNKIRQRLIMNGFNISKINELLEKKEEN